MASILEVELQITAVSKCKIPFNYSKVCSSGDLSLFGSEWKLQMRREELNGSDDRLSLRLIRTSVGRVVERFRVETSLRDLGKDPFTFEPSEKTVENPKEVIWSLTCAGDKEFSDCEIVCIFRPASSRNVNGAENGTVQIITESQYVGLHSMSADFSNMLEDRICTDVTLKCGDRTMPAHRNILSARSEVFAAMLRNKMVESEDDVVEIRDVDPELLEVFLKYVYSGKLPELSEDMLTRMYDVGDMYAIRSLQKECSTWILRHLTKENCLALLLLADKHSDVDFKDKVANFIVKNVCVLKGEAWSLLRIEYPKIAFYVYEKFLPK